MSMRTGNIIKSIQKLISKKITEREMLKKEFSRSYLGSYRDPNLNRIGARIGEMSKTIDELKAIIKEGDGE